MHTLIRKTPYVSPGLACKEPAVATYNRMEGIEIFLTKIGM